MEPLVTDSPSIRVAAAQMECATGDLETNLQTCLAMVAEASRREADMVVFPELALTGAKLEGRVLEVARRLDSWELSTIAKASGDINVIVGFVEEGRDGRIYNSAVCFENGHPVYVHRKLYLVSYGSLNEGRLFAPGAAIDAFATRLGRLGLCICEDVWHSPLPYLAAMDGAEILVTSAGSPEGLVSSSATSRELWSAVLRAHAVMLNCFHVFANRAGREDDLVYWGGSMIWGPGGELLAEASSAEPALVVADMDLVKIRDQRFLTPFLRDERIELTLRELSRIGRQRLMRDASDRKQVDEMS
jgi:predicted amidohydrolase